MQSPALDPRVFTRQLKLRRGYPVLVWSSSEAAPVRGFAVQIIFWVRPDAELTSQLVRTRRVCGTAAAPSTLNRELACGSLRPSHGLQVGLEERPRPMGDD